MPSLEVRRAEAVKVCRDSYDSQGVVNVRELCECLIEGWRDDLERAKSERCQALQGRIQGLRELLGEIKPLPDPQPVDE